MQSLPRPEGSSRGACVAAPSRRGRTASSVCSVTMSVLLASAAALFLYNLARTRLREHEKVGEAG
jgi:hypothetical protein